MPSIGEAFSKPFPDTPCMPYMPTLTPKPPQCKHIWHTWSAWDLLIRLVSRWWSDQRGEVEVRAASTSKGAWGAGLTIYPLEDGGWSPELPSYHGPDLPAVRLRLAVIVLSLGHSSCWRGWRGWAAHRGSHGRKDLQVLRSRFWMHLLWAVDQ